MLHLHACCRGNPTHAEKLLENLTFFFCIFWLLLAVVACSFWPQGFFPGHMQVTHPANPHGPSGNKKLGTKAPSAATQCNKRQHQQLHVAMVRQRG